MMAYSAHVVGIHARVKVRCKLSDKDPGKLVESTVGTVYIQSEYSSGSRLCRQDPGPYSLEVDFLCDKKKLGQIIDKCYKVHGKHGNG